MTAGNTRRQIGRDANANKPQKPAEREGGLFRHFHQRVCEQLGMTPNDAVKPRSEAESA